MYHVYIYIYTHIHIIHIFADFTLLERWDIMQYFTNLIYIQVYIYAYVSRICTYNNTYYTHICRFHIARALVHYAVCDEVYIHSCIHMNIYIYICICIYTHISHIHICRLHIARALRHSAVFDKMRIHSCIYIYVFVSCICIYTHICDIHICRFHIARALGHYAVFDEFGSGLPLHTVHALCVGVRKFVALR